MERITISLDDELAHHFDQFMNQRGYSNRSEAIRDLIREKLESERLEESKDGDCIGSLNYVYNHHERELAAKLTSAQHDHHNLAISTLHVHLDHDHCMETVILKGPVEIVRSFANSVISRPGVRHGELYLVPVDIEEKTHDHGSDSHSPHVHTRPQT